MPGYAENWWLAIRRCSTRFASLLFQAFLELDELFEAEFVECRYWIPWRRVPTLLLLAVYSADQLEHEFVDDLEQVGMAVLIRQLLDQNVGEARRRLVTLQPKRVDHLELVVLDQTIEQAQIEMLKVQVLDAN